MTSEELFEKVLSRAKEWGLKPISRDNNDPKGNGVVRKNLGSKKNDTDTTAPYFGFISESEPLSGAYSDFSFVIFPDKTEGEMECCIVTLVVGSLGFMNDYQLASEPGLRREFLTLRSLNSDYTYFKNSFDDIGSSLTMLRNDASAKTSAFQVSLAPAKYGNVIQAATLLDMTGIDTPEIQALDTIFSWLAVYGNMRGWGTQAQKRERDRWLREHLGNQQKVDIEAEVKELINKHKFVVLQGAPGTGKTHTASQIAKSYAQCFFIQFNAETTYSDFVYGLQPDTANTGSTPRFIARKGALYQAIEAARTTHKDVLLIIDEINRANLANVLGPVFYLFEKNATDRGLNVDLGGGLNITKLPDNLHVIATMNTADRSLAVVDFALRRRFVWYTIHPQEIKPTSSSQKFCKTEFEEMASIFRQYATDEELNLQPGPAYFIVDKQDAYNEMKGRMKYELMPLIKEYLNEGYLSAARNELSNYFLRNADSLIYE